MNILEVKNLEKSFGGIKAVNNCTFSVEENKIVSLIGPNGAGKTTIFNLITNIVEPDKGKTIFRGEPIKNLRTYKIASLGLTRTFQLVRLFHRLTALENVMLAKRQIGETLFANLLKPKLVKEEEKQNRERSLEFLRLVDLEEKAHHKALHLSYGQQKLLEIARALATESTLILLDEPVAGVNPKLREKIKEILLKIKQEGKTLLIIEHDMNFVMNLSDKVIVMDEGRVIAEGLPKQIQNNKQVLLAYLGK